MSHPQENAGLPLTAKQLMSLEPTTMSEDPLIMSCLALQWVIHILPPHETV